MDIHPEYKDVCTVVLEWEGSFMVMYVIELLLFRIIPVVAIAVLNVSIVVRVSKIRSMKMLRAPKAMTEVELKDSGGRRCEKLNTHGERRETGERPNPASSGTPASAPPGSQMTLMLTVVSTCHVIVCLPVLIHFVLWRLHRAEFIYLSPLGHK